MRIICGRMFFFRVRYIEQLGTGTTDLTKRCLDLDWRCPEFRQDEKGHETGHEKTAVQRIVLTIGGQTLTRKKMMEKMSLKGRDNFRTGYLEPSMSGGYVAPLYPNSAKRRDQAYYLTPKGLELFALLKKDK